MKQSFKQNKWIILGSLCATVAVALLYRNNWFSQNCNIKRILLRGDLKAYMSPQSYNDSGHLTADATSSEDIRNALLSARDDKSIDAVIISVDSYGGSIVAADEIAAAIKEAGKPVIAIVGGSALSSAYHAISPANAIFASEYSEIGGLGVTMSYLEKVEKNKKEGLSYIGLASGKFKELGNPDKPISWEERHILQKQLNELHGLIMRDVADNRHLPPERVKLFADGSYFNGTEAKELGLIDKVGTYFDALRLLENKIGKKVELCRQ